MGHIVLRLDRVMADRKISLNLFWKVKGCKLCKFECCKFRKKQNPFFYPYCNAACEVDWYRFRPVLNEIGEAFLTMDRFLNEGHMYKIKF